MQFFSLFFCSRFFLLFSLFIIIFFSHSLVSSKIVSVRFVFLLERFWSSSSSSTTTTATTTTRRRTPRFLVARLSRRLRGGRRRRLIRLHAHSRNDDSCPFIITTEKEIIHLSSGGGGSSRTRELAATFINFPRQSLKSYPACLSTARVFWCCMGTDAGVDVRIIYSLELFFLYLFFFPQECTRRVKGSLFWCETTTFTFLRWEGSRSLFFRSDSARSRRTGNRGYPFRRNILRFLIAFLRHGI